MLFINTSEDDLQDISAIVTEIHAKKLMKSELLALINKDGGLIIMSFNDIRDQVGIQSSCEFSSSYLSHKVYSYTSCIYIPCVPSKVN